MEDIYRTSGEGLGSRVRLGFLGKRAKGADLHTEGGKAGSQNKLLGRVGGRRRAWR